jgi:hypothetical protein
MYRVDPRAMTSRRMSPRETLCVSAFMQLPSSSKSPHRCKTCFSWQHALLGTRCLTKRSLIGGSITADNGFRSERSPRLELFKEHLGPRSSINQSSQLSTSQIQTYHISRLQHAQESKSPLPFLLEFTQPNPDLKGQVLQGWRQ